MTMNTETRLRILAPVLCCIMAGSPIAFAGPLAAETSVFYLDTASPVFRSEISRIDLPAGDVVAIGPVETRLSGIDFAPDGRLIGISSPDTAGVPPQTIPSLLEIDTSDAEVVSETPSGLDLGALGFIVDLHFDRDGRLWVLHGNRNTIPVPIAMRVSELDPVTGALIRQSTLDDVTSFVAIGEDELGFYALPDEPDQELRRVDFESGMIGDSIPLEPFFGIRNPGGDSDTDGLLYFFFDVFYLEDSDREPGIMGANLVTIDPDVGIVTAVGQELAFSGLSPAIEPGMSGALAIPALGASGRFLLIAVLLAAAMLHLARSRPDQAAGRPRK